MTCRPVLCIRIEGGLNFLNGLRRKECGSERGVYCFETRNSIYAPPRLGYVLARPAGWEMGHMEQVPNQEIRYLSMDLNFSVASRYNQVLRVWKSKKEK